MSLEIYITKTATAELNHFYKNFVLKRYYDDEIYFKKFGTKEQFESCAVYIKWIKYFKSDQYVTDLNKIIKLWKDDIIGGFNIYMEEAIDMEDDDEALREQLIKINNNFDGTFEYVSKVYEDNLYHSVISYEWIYDTLDNRII